MKVLSNKITDLRVQLKSHLRPFDVATYLCDNPDCPCTNATLEFTEIEEDGSDVSRPICFGFKLDIETWQKHENTNHSEQINALIDEFINDLSDEIKAMFKEAYDLRGERKRKLANFSMPPEDIRRGMLVSFSEVMSDTEKYDCVPRYGFKITSQDQAYLIDDLYCSNPKCDCKTVNLMFLKYEEKAEKVTLTGSFLAAVSLNGKSLTFPDLRKYSESQAAALVRVWRQAYPNAIDRCKIRYKEIRQATNRLLKTSRDSQKNIETPPFPLVRITSKPNLMLAEKTAERVPPSALPKNTSPPIGKIGRNDPCPCGSGKKYKKCCSNIKGAFRKSSILRPRVF